MPFIAAADPGNVEARPVPSTSLLYPVAMVLLQAGLFAVVAAPVERRIVCVCLLLITLAEWWRPYLFATSPRTGAAVLAACSAANYLAFSISADPGAARLVQVALILGYILGGVAALAGLTGRPVRGRVFVALLAGGLTLFALEAVLGTQPRQHFWTGGTHVVGAIPVGTRDGAATIGALEASAWSEYPNDPHGYLEDPAAWQKAWTLVADASGSGAMLEFPDSWAEGLRVRQVETAPTHPWSIQVVTSPVSVRLGERYTVAFRARSSASGSLHVGLGLGHPPWTRIGLYEQVSLDTLWRWQRFGFTVPVTDTAARLFFDVGAVPGLIELARVSVTRDGTGERLRSVVPDRHLVRYRLNSDGCRHGERPTGRRGRAILVTGGASALGIGIHEEDTFASKLEGLLNASSVMEPGALPIEVLPCPLGGGGSSPGVKSLTALAARYAPELVVLTVGVHEPIRWRAPGDGTRPGIADRVGRVLFTWNRLRSWLASRRPADGDLGAGLVSVQLDSLRRAAPAVPIVLLALRADADDRWPEFLRRVRAIADSTGIAMLDVGAALTRFQSAAHLVVDPEYDPRPGPLAHAAAADTVAAFLRERGLLGIR